VGQGLGQLTTKYFEKKWELKSMGRTNGFEKKELPPVKLPEGLN
jgi:hypothetical protein